MHLAIVVNSKITASNLEGSIARISGRLSEGHIDVAWPDLEASK
jgi:hypothetical protein